MSSSVLKATLSKTGIASSVLLLANGVAMAAGSTVNLTAGATQAALPDGQTVPMWGYTCDAAPAPANAACAAMNPNAAGNWSPVVITVPSGNSLTINLTNSLSFPDGVGGPNLVPTSLVIVGQLGGGLGTDRVLFPPGSFAHAPQGTTWPGTPGDADASSCLPGGDPGAAGTFCPPDQAQRVRSMATEVTTGNTTALTWNNLRPGTYLIESGTEPSIQGPMGLYGMLVVTTAPIPAADPAPAVPGLAYPGVNYDADLALLMSEIDPVQNATVDEAVRTDGFSDAAIWSAQAGACGDPAVHTCYPPAVNYSPLYFLINGVSFDRTNMPGSLLAANPDHDVTGSVLVRLVNAGLRMHIPTIPGAQTGSVSGVSLIAEDGNVLPGNRRVQNEVFMAAGKTTDVLMNAPTAGAPALAVFDRALSLSTNNQRDGGMQAHISVNGAAISGDLLGFAVAAGDKAYYCVIGATLAVTDPSKGVLGGAVGANGATLGSTAGLVAGTLQFNANGTFTYTTPSSATDCGGSFTFLVNGSAAHTATITRCDVGTPGCDAYAGAPTANSDSYDSKIASRYQASPPGVLANDNAGTSNLPLKAVIVPASESGGTVSLNPDGSFTATPSGAAPTSVTFHYNAVNSQNTPSGDATSGYATVTVNFDAGNGKTFNVVDVKTGDAINDYRWIIEEDRTFNGNAAENATPGATLGTNFHTSYMPVVAQGCVGTVSCEIHQTVLDDTGGHVAAVCDVGNGKCRTDAEQQTPVTPDQVVLAESKRYYISILPGDGQNPVVGGAGGAMPVDPNDPDGAQRQFDIAQDCGAYDAGTDTHWEPGGPNALCGHAMGGAQFEGGANSPSITVRLQQTPMPPAKIAVLIFQDDDPLNGENDAGGGIDILAPNEPGLGEFNIVLLDQTGGLGDSAGQLTYDEFGMPVSNSLAHQLDPVTGVDACPISPTSTDGIVGTIPVCPTFEADGITRSPLAGQAVIANMYPGLYEVAAAPGADRIARGEEWLQTNTLDGTKPIEAFIRPGEPAYFQEFGPGGYHVAVGFANPAIIKARKGEANDGKQLFCSNQPCTATVNGQVTNLHMSRTPDQRVYSSGDYSADSFTQCYVSLGPPDGADFDFAKCDAEGKFTFSGVPTGNYRVTVFDQWNDLLVDGLSTPIVVGNNANGLGNTTNTQCTGNPVVCSYEIAVTQWRANLATRTFIDVNGDGVSQPEEPGLPLASTNIRYRDGSIGFFNNTDLDGYAGFNEVFPFLNWLVVETDSTRYKNTGVHVVYDAGGAVDCDPLDTTKPCQPGTHNSAVANYVASTVESPTAHVPPALRTPGAVYCDDAECTGETINPPSPSAANPSTGRIDPPWAPSEGWQGLLGQTSYIEFGKKPFAPTENGGIKGHVIYTSTRPFDDPALLLQLSWEPGVPNVKLNLYQVGTAADGTQSLKLVDTTTSTSWDDWAQGFRRDPNNNMLPGDGVSNIPNMSCPGIETSSPFYFTLEDSKQWLNPGVTLAEHSRFKCFDGWSALNQVQPAPYDGMYKFPSVVAKSTPTGTLPATDDWSLQLDAKTYKTNCTICTPNPDDNTPMLPPGKYVVEVVVPAGYELVKEEDKNILLGDVYVAPVTQQFAGFGNIYIMPDQAAINAYYNPYNAIQSTTNNGASPRHEGDTGSVETFWPCVGDMRVVPDLNSLYPDAGQQAPFAGASRPLCDRKLVTLENQMAVLAKFYVFNSTHIAGHFTGAITNDFASEFDPFSPAFGEKFAPPNLPVSLRDFNGNEMGRVVSDVWGAYNGLNYSTYSVNPPSPSGYIPTMMIACMNDPGPIPDPANPGQMITDPNYNPAYSNYCYEIPFMPGQTAYLDTPVIPTMAFADNYNLPDCEYPDATPAILRVDGDGIGPWVLGAAGQVTQVNVTNPGAGYTARPTATFNNTGTGGTGVAATNAATTGAFLNVTRLALSAPGSNYTSAPLVAINGGGGSGATATADMRVNTIPAGNITNRGSGYTSAPTVTFPGGTGGVFAVTMRVDQIVLSNPGAGYIARPTTTFNNTGTGGTGAAAANGTAAGTFLSVTNIVRSAGGSGYTSAPGVALTAPPCTINGTTCIQATAHANLTGAVVTSFTMDNIGAGYTSRPTVTISNAGHGGTGAAAANAATTGTFLSINRVVLSANGSGYLTRPAVTFTAAPAGSPGSTTAAATNGATTGTFLSLNAIAVTNGGSGYTGVNAIFDNTGTNGSGAVATATLNVNALIVTAPGSGYTSRPTVAFDNTGTGGTGAAAANATTTGVFLSLEKVVLSSPGSGYASPPAVTISAPGCTINGTTCVLATATASISAGSQLTIKALGDKLVVNHAYSGPSSSTPPYNEKFITRHYGFGSQPGTCPTGAGVPCPNVTVGGVALTNVTWGDTQITGTVPGGVPSCTVQQAGQPAAQCGQLEITAANGKKSIDTVTVTIGGKPPTHVSPASPSSGTFGSTLPNRLQTAIDNAAPGDLIIVEAGTYKEQVLMWKPVRLQGVGAASVTIDADAHPAGRVDPWRRQVDCLFGLSLNGRPLINDGTFPADTYDATGRYNCPANMQQRVDRIPMEAIVGWDTAGNGNLAQLLQEPTLMGAYEGAGITVLGRGVRIPANSTDFWGASNAGSFPAGYQYLTNSAADCTANSTLTNGRDYGTSNFRCNPSSIDGISVINSSQGGGAIFLHAWNHNIQVANNRISANHGTLTGGITVGNGEFPDPFIVGGDNPPPPGLSTTGLVTDQQAGYGFNTFVNVHHNSVTSNASIGDALYSGTPSAAGGVTFCSGADNYQFNYNWVCGNLSTGDGGGVAHAGFSNDGTIGHNWIIFNQSTNPTIPTHGGGLAILGASPDRTLPNGLECGNSAADVDCPPGLPEGTGRNLQINANLIIGNSAESGTGGGLRLQEVNGQDMEAFPTTSSRWNTVSVTNNIIADNVAGWDGGGVSLQDAVRVSFVNNTVVANDTTASAGVLFNTLGATLAAVPPPGCTPQSDPSLPQDPGCINPVPTSTPQAAGLVTMTHTPNLMAVSSGFTCPSGYGYHAPGSGTTNTTCRSVSLPLLANNLFWQNRSFHVEVGNFGAGLQSQQHLVSLEPILDQISTGYCDAVGADHLGNPLNVAYWDIGVRGDSGPVNHGSGFTLTPTNSILSSLAGGYTTGGTNIGPDSSTAGAGAGILKEYCNGSRLPPENGGHGYTVPPGHSETTGLYPVFDLNNITPAATVDEGNNWINLGYGPLSLISPPSELNPTTEVVLGNYAIASTSVAINAATSSGAPPQDFFGTTRPQGSAIDIGAVEFVGTATLSPFVDQTSLNFGNVVGTTGTSDMTLTLRNPAGNPAGTLNTITLAFSGTNASSFTRNGGTCTTSLTAGSSCTIIVRFTSGAISGTPKTASLAITGSQPVTGSPVSLSGTSVAAIRTASVTPSSLAFGNWATSTTSTTQNLTVTNTGNTSLTSLTYTLGGGSPQPFSRVTTGTFPTGAPNCGGTLNVGAVCTVKVQFAPASAAAFPRTLTVGGGGAGAVITPTSVNLTGTGVAGLAAVSVTPTTLTITVPGGPDAVSPGIGTGVVTLTNTAAPGSSQVAVTSVAVAGGSPTTWFFDKVAGQDYCTGTALAPGQSCTVAARFTNVSGPTGVNQPGTITFTDTALGSPQVGNLIGFAAP